MKNLIKPKNNSNFLIKIAEIRTFGNRFNKMIV
jgi:hypothetical protein